MENKFNKMFGESQLANAKREYTVGQQFLRT